MSEYHSRPDHFISEQSSVFSHPRLSHQRIDSQIEYFTSALSDLQSRAGRLAEENQHLHDLLNTTEDGRGESDLHETEDVSGKIGDRKDVGSVEEYEQHKIHFDSKPKNHKHRSLSEEVGLLREENGYLKSKLAVEETVHRSLLTRIQQPSLCAVCHSSEAIYPVPSQQRESERDALLRKLTAEREECMQLLTGLRDTLQHARDRENEAVDKVKQSLDTASAALEEKDQTLLRVIELEREVEDVSKRQESLLVSAREQHDIELEGVRRDMQHKYTELEGKLAHANGDVKLKDSEISSLFQSKQVLDRKLKAIHSEMFDTESKSMRTVGELRSRVGVLEAEKLSLSGVVESLKTEQESSEARSAQELSRARLLADQQRSCIALVREESAKLREQTLEAETERNRFKNQLRTLKYELETANTNRQNQVVKLEETCNVKCRKLVEEVNRLTELDEVLRIELEAFRERETRVVSGGQDELKRVHKKFDKQISSLSKELEETKDSLTHLELAYSKCNGDKLECENTLIQERRDMEKVKYDLKLMREKRREDTNKIKDLMARHNSLLRERLQLCQMIEDLYQRPGKEADKF